MREGAVERNQTDRGRGGAGRGGLNKYPGRLRRDRWGRAGRRERCRLRSAGTGGWAARHRLLTAAGAVRDGFCVAMNRIDRENHLRPQEDDAAKDGKNGFQSRIVRRSGLFLLGVHDLLHVFGGLFLEILEAGLAAKLHFLAVLDQHVRFTHVAAQNLIGNDARLERVRFGLLFGLFVIGRESGQRCGEENAEKEGGGDFLECFHTILVR